MNATPATTDTTWARLLPAALVGTARQALPVADAPGQAAALLQTLAGQAQAHPAEQLLRQAAVLAVCAQAAASGLPPQPANPAPPDTTPSLQDSACTAHLRWLLQSSDEAPTRLLHEALLLLHARGWRLPATLLPAALDAGRRNTTLRPALLPVLGTRGQWLATQSSDWRYAAPSAPPGADTTPAPTDTDWHTGTLVQRQAWLHAARQRQPAQARAALAQALPDLPATERAALLPALALQLGPDDQALLTQLLQDRSRDVRQTAASLLSTLPDSPHAQAMCQRMAALLPAPAAGTDTPASGGLLGRALSALGHAASQSAGHWLQPNSLQAPQAPQPDWKASQIEAQRPKHETLGERAWWLYQIVRQTPLHWWHQHTGAHASALLQWAHQTDWADALTRGWLDALHAHAAVTPIDPTAHTAAPSPADTTAAARHNALIRQWTLALLRHGGKSAHLHSTRADLLALLPAAEREPFWAHTLQGDARLRADKLDTLLQQMLAACPPGQTLSEPLAQTLLQTLATLLKNKALHQTWLLRPQLRAAVCLLPASVLPAVAQLPRLDDEPDSLRHALQLCQHTAVARQALLQMPAAAG